MKLNWPKPLPQMEATRGWLGKGIFQSEKATAIKWIFQLWKLLSTEGRSRMRWQLTHAVEIH